MKRSLGFVAVLCAGSIAGAQTQPTVPDACVEKIPSSSLKRVPVFLEATADSASREILPQADLFTQSVAFKIRELLGGNETKLPEADSAVSWSLLWGEVLVTAHKSGPLSWAVPRWSVMADTFPHSPLQLLQKALRDVVANGETLILPESMDKDSVSFSLSLLNPIVEKSGKLVPLKARQAIPVFTIGVAWSKPAELTREPNIDYPAVYRSMSFISNVRLAFAVDKDGKADMESVEELWPAGQKRPTGQLLNAYESFLREVKRGLPSARFSPAMRGGCVVKQMVTQTFEFKVR